MTSRITTFTLAAVAATVAFTAPAQATFPGQNGRIAFQRGEGAEGDFNLWTANPDGSHVRKLTDVPSFFSDWSADGRRVAYDLEDTAGDLQIATVNPDGTEVRPLTSGPAVHGYPSFSPDGSQIAYEYAPTWGVGFHTSLWVMDADDGSHQHALAPGSPDTFDGEPRFSPDGKSVAFIRIRKALGHENQQNALFVMEVDGTNARQLTPWGQVVEFPSWSPDGPWSAFADKTINPPGSGSRSILVIRPDGSGKRVIYQGRRTAEGVKPVFSPDGSKILFVCVDHKPAVDVGLCTINRDGSRLVHITNTREFVGWERNPSWGTSPLL